MNKALCCTVLLAIGFFALANLSSRADQSKQTKGLPGARPTIQAINYPSLQAAFDALPANGGKVVLPAGTFVITKPLVVRAEDVCIEGSGTATHIKNANKKGEPALVLEHPDGGTSRKKELWRIRLANFQVTGNPQSGTGIDCRRINEVFIDGVTVSRNGGDGIRLFYCYEDPRICDSLITYNKKIGINLVGCHDITVSANQFEENNDALRCINGYNLTMSGNTIDDHLRHGVVIENTYGSVLSGNMIEECNGTAIILDRNCYGNTLSANVIAHNGAGIDLRDAHGCAVSANTFTLMKKDALRIGPSSGRIAVSGNSFCNSYIGEGKVKRRVDDLEAAGMVLDGTKDIGITGNVFSSVKPKAIELKGKTTRVLVDGNIFTDVTSDHEKKVAPAGVGDNLDSK